MRMPNLVYPSASVLLYLLTFYSGSLEDQAHCNCKEINAKKFEYILSFLFHTAESPSPLFTFEVKPILERLCNQSPHIFLYP